MEGVQPTLEVRVGIPKANNVIAVFVKFHFQAEWVTWTTCKAVVALFFQSSVWVLDLFHFNEVLIVFGGKDKKILYTKKESIIADELFFVTPTGFKPVTF